MIDHASLEQQHEQHLRKSHELAMRIEALDKEVEGLLAELNVTPEILESFLSNPHYFTPDNWQELQRLKHELDERLKRELANVRDPRENRKRLEELRNHSQWLFVR